MECSWRCSINVHQIVSNVSSGESGGSVLSAGRGAPDREQALELRLDTSLKSCRELIHLDFTSRASHHGLQTRHPPNKAARYISITPLLTAPLQTHESTGKRIPKLPKETSIYIQGSTSDLYHRVAAESRFDIHRLRITKEDGTLVPNDKKTTVNSLDLKDGSVIQVKDLGP